MLVAIEHRPNLVMFLERFLLAPASSRKPELPSTFHGLGRYGVRNSDTRVCFNFDQRAPTNTLERLEVGWLSIPAFAEEHEELP